MPAAITDKFAESTTTGRPVAAALTAQKIIGATTLTVDSTAEWPTATAVHFTMFKIDANNQEIANTRTDWKGIVASSTSITNITLRAGTDADYPIGSKVICAPTAAWADDLVGGILTHTDQDGTLKADAVDVTAVIKDNVVSNAKLSEFKPNEVVSDFIASGGVVAQSAGLVGTFSNIVYYIGGIRYTATSIPNKTYTASKDTYVDINSSGTPTYTEVANGAASPALTSGYIRVAKVVTNGSAITSVVQYGADTVTTSGAVNWICNRDPYAGQLYVWPNTGGTVAGVFYYRTRLGIKELWGATSAGTSSASPHLVTFPLPASFFNAVNTVHVALSPAAAVGQYCNISAFSTTQVTVYIVREGGGTAATNNIFLSVKGF